MIIFSPKKVNVVRTRWRNKNQIQFIIFNEIKDLSRQISASLSLVVGLLWIFVMRCFISLRDEISGGQTFIKIDTLFVEWEILSSEFSWWTCCNTWAGKSFVIRWDLWSLRVTSVKRFSRSNKLFKWFRCCHNLTSTDRNIFALMLIKLLLFCVAELLRNDNKWNKRGEHSLAQLSSSRSFWVFGVLRRWNPILATSSRISIDIKCCELTRS